MQEFVEMVQCSDDFSFSEEFKVGSPYEIETDLSSPPRLNLFDEGDDFDAPSLSWDQENSKTKKIHRRKGIMKLDLTTKKAIKQIRNRVAAQKSRDKKKQEMETLKNELEQLQKENEALKHQLQETRMQIEDLTPTADQTNSNKTPNKESSTTRNTWCKILLMACMVGYLCIKDESDMIKPLEKPIELKEELTPDKCEYSRDEQLNSLRRQRKEFIKRNNKVRRQVEDLSNLEPQEMKTEYPIAN